MRVFVRKLNGDIEPFREEKLENSLRRAGASEQTIDLIMEKVKKILFNSIETSVLFDFVFNEFSRLEPQVSQKYNLKKALLSFGNDGFVFEKFVAKILEAKGYSTELDTQVKGKFVTHEIDILAQKEKELL
ncbi:MAG: ATPase, partial [Candidatus Diapherotrites archaeon]|nr:ATPase [Candidatus Diapherotrites archaeon]